MSRWEDVLDQQVELWQFWRSPRGHDYARGWTLDKKEKYGRDDMWAERHVREIQEATMFHAEPIAVEPDMWTLIEAAQLSFEPEPLRADDLITPNGFILLPRPILSQDIWGRLVSYRAIGWMPSLRAPKFDIPESPALELAAGLMADPEVYGIWLSLYTHIDDPDYYTQEGIAKYGNRFREGMPVLSLGHQMPWEFGRDYRLKPPEKFAGMHDGSVYKEAGIDLDVAIAQQVAVLRSVQAIFRIMQQTIAVHAQHHPDRATRRRSQRAEYPEKDVTVIYLRRPRRDDYQERNGDGEHKEIEWKSRWLVAGHWRNQWFPSKNEHRQIWINPYIKGPEDKPLQVREKRAFVFGR